MPSKPVGELTCPVCGKIFHCYYVDDWTYKKQWFNKKYVFCSWTCFRKKEKELQDKRTKRGRKKKEE